MPITIAVTGSSGFVGSTLVDTLRLDPAFNVRALYRRPPRGVPVGIEAYATGNLEDRPDLEPALSGVDVLVHAAARAHIIVDEAKDPDHSYHRANVTSTQVLLQAAIRAQVRRFIFLSSAAVHGESTSNRHPFTETDAVQPATAYAASKVDAEASIWLGARAGAIEVVVLRPPLVYGPRVKGNMQRLIRLINAGTPLPLASVSNVRSMIAIGNLVSAISAVSVNPAAAGQTFLVSDQRDVSTPDLVRTLAAGLGRPARLFPFPAGALSLAAQLVGRSRDVRSLTQSLVIDSSAITAKIGWRPIERPTEVLLETARQALLH